MKYQVTSQHVQSDRDVPVAPDYPTWTLETLLRALVGAMKDMLQWRKGRIADLR